VAQAPEPRQEEAQLAPQESVKPMPEESKDKFYQAVKEWAVEHKIQEAHIPLYQDIQWFCKQRQTPLANIQAFAGNRFNCEWTDLTLEQLKTIRKRVAPKGE
jgi:hypothetical protein